MPFAWAPSTDMHATSPVWRCATTGRAQSFLLQHKGSALPSGGQPLSILNALRLSPGSAPNENVLHRARHWRSWLRRPPGPDCLRSPGATNALGWQRTAACPLPAKKRAGMTPGLAGTDKKRAPPGARFLFNIWPRQIRHRFDSLHSISAPALPWPVGHSPGTRGWQSPRGCR